MEPENRRWILLRSFVVLLLVPLWAPAAPQVSARQALDRKLAEYRGGASGGEILEITHPSLATVLPRHSVYVLRFRKYPVARQPPAPLAANNIFVVKPDQSVELITSPGSLEKLYASTIPQIDTAALAENTGKAWLRLVQELHQDGLFRFSEPKVSAPLMTRDLPPSNIRVSGTLSVMPNNGDMGQISTTLVFNRGKLASVMDSVDLKAGIRPICQATKLLDPDPIVRGMAEQSLLVMGQSARGYLEEQRALASPELRRAIDRIWQRIVDEGR